jgi:4-amino-4-deoxy-L-arabinose transferase-like glycosyltransferase
VVAVPVVLVCLFAGLTSFGLVGPDEPRYAAIARDMAATGDWVTPRLNGEPWMEKPILYYWAAAAAYRALGDSEAAARLPSALSALISTLVLAWLGLRAYGRRTAVIVALLFPTTVAAIGFARGAGTDMIFATCVVLVMAAAYRLAGIREETASWRARAVFGAALGAAVLAKGPVGVVLTAGALTPWILSTRQWGRIPRYFAPLSIAAFALVALPWYVLVALRNADFVQVFIIEHNVQRFLTPVFQHQQPFWFFGGVLLIGLAPWTALLVVALARGVATVRARGTSAAAWARSPSLFFACWALFPLLFFSLSKSKLPGYILPAVPPIALLLAFVLADLETSASTTAKRLFLAGAVVLVAMGVALLIPGVVPSAIAQLEGAALYLLGAIAIGAGGAVALYAARGRPAEALLATAVGMAIFVACLAWVLMPRADPAVSPRSAAQRAARLADGDDVVTYRLHRAWQYGLDYYLDRPARPWSGIDAPGGLVVTTDEGAGILQRSDHQVRVLERVSEEAVLLVIEPPRARGGTR